MVACNDRETVHMDCRWLLLFKKPSTVPDLALVEFPDELRFPIGIISLWIVMEQVIDGANTPTFSKSFAVFSPMPFKVSMDWSSATCFTLLFILSYGAVRSTLRECRKFPAFYLAEKAASSGLLTKGSSFSVRYSFAGYRTPLAFPAYSTESR